MAGRKEFKMNMQVDRRVAELRGWTSSDMRGDDPASRESYWMAGSMPVMAAFKYRPSTNLLQAMQLWDEARPEGWWVKVEQDGKRKWLVFRTSYRYIRDMGCVGLTDLPRLITQAWVDAKGKTP